MSSRAPNAAYAERYDDPGYDDPFYDDPGAAGDVAGYLNPALETGERICPPRSRGLMATLANIVIAMAAGISAWQAYANRDAIASYFPSATAEPAAPPLVSAPDANRLASAEPAAGAPLAPTAEAASHEIEDAPGSATGQSVEAAPHGQLALPAAAEDSDTLQEVPPLPAPVVDPKDLYQKKAMAVGLHPDISRAVLKRLTSADYRNAGIAVRTAIAETPEDGTYAWPRKAGVKLALFEVHFVKGASGDCRRYVVTVTKDGWSTTAPPMEKCGVSIPGRHGKTAAID